MSIDGEAPLQRRFDATLLTFITKHPLFKAMRCGIDEGNILPALRKQEVDFYETGARLLRFRGKSVFTHRRYIDCEGNRERALRAADEWNAVTLEKIRRKTSRYRTQKKADSELAAVHQLFREFAITRGQHRAGELALIDVEARFAPASAEGLLGGMIDLVFLLPDCRLLFIEAKCIGNGDLLSTKVAPVVAQVRKYECHIKRGGVLDAMNRSLCLQSRLIGHDLGQAKSIAARVPVLILDPDHCGLSLHPKDTWLKKALAIAPNWSFDPDEVAVINGMSNPPAAAIRAFVAKFLT